MSRKELEAKVSKYLRKAKRKKTPTLQLEKINDVIRLLRGYAHQHLHEANQPIHHQESQKHAVGLYIELCALHKLKFQMDALFDEARETMTRVHQDPSRLNQLVFRNLVYSLETVRDIDPYHPEAHALLETLCAEYPEYAQQYAPSNLYLDISPYQRSTLCIEIACNVTEIMKNATLQSLYEPYQIIPHKFDVTEADSSPEICRLRFFQNQLRIFETFHETLRTRPTYSISVNRQPIDEKSFSEWLHCYKGFLKARTTQYCYGGSPFTCNIFGCHKICMKDIARHLEDCWFHYGTLDTQSGLFLVDIYHIAEQIRARLPHCGFCPALTQEKLQLGMALLPRAINPEYDTRWNYFYTNGEQSGIIPAGRDIGLSIGSNSSQPGAFIEVGVTPYIERMFRYLWSDDLTELSDTGYKSLSHCIACGAVYKPHTMTCPRCKTDFHQYALKDIEGVLADIRYARPLDILPVQDTAPESAKRRPTKKTRKKQAKTVSFSQLWEDPEVRKILSKTEHEAKHQTSSGPKTSTAASHTRPEQSPAKSPAASDAKFSSRFALHKKLRGLLSKKYRERKALEKAFSQTQDSTPPPAASHDNASWDEPPPSIREDSGSGQTPQHERQHAQEESAQSQENPEETEDLREALRKLKPRQRSELSKRGVVRVIYHATIDKEICPLCEYLDGMVMDPDDPATDIFSPPLFPGCTCSREYILKTEKPGKWPQVTFQFPPEDLLVYLEK